jgi:hypothetical protein
VSESVFLKMGGTDYQTVFGGNLPPSIAAGWSLASKVWRPGRRGGIFKTRSASFPPTTLVPPTQRESFQSKVPNGIRQDPISKHQQMDIQIR